MLARGRGGGGLGEGEFDFFLSEGCGGAVFLQVASAGQGFFFRRPLLGWGS